MPWQAQQQTRHRTVFLLPIERRLVFILCQMTELQVLLKITRTSSIFRTRAHEEDGCLCVWMFWTVLLADPQPQYSKIPSPFSMCLCVCVVLSQ